jgi:uncharacterized membrane protein
MMQNRIILFIVFFVLISSSFSVAQDKEPPKKKSKNTVSKSKNGTVSFKNEVYPLMKKYCLPCHSEEQMNPSELYMDSYETIMEGGKQGEPVVAGKADSSLIILKLGEKPPFGDRMPLKAKQPLSDEEVKILKDWINQGAKKN